MRECSTCGFDAVGTCDACAEPFCWSHGDGLPAGTPGRLHATCAALGRSDRANEARSLGRLVADLGFLAERPDVVDRRRAVWSILDEEREVDPRRRFRLLSEVVVVEAHRPGSGDQGDEPGFGVDAEGHFWGLGPPAAAASGSDPDGSRRGDRGSTLRRFRRLLAGPTEHRTIAPPRPGVTGARRPADELAPGHAGERELLDLRALVAGRPLPTLSV